MTESSELLSRSGLPAREHPVVHHRRRLGDRPVTPCADLVEGGKGLGEVFRVEVSNLFEAHGVGLALRHRVDHRDQEAAGAMPMPATVRVSERRRGNEGAELPFLGLKVHLGGDPFLDHRISGADGPPRLLGRLHQIDVVVELRVDLEIGERDQAKLVHRAAIVGDSVDHSELGLAVGEAEVTEDRKREGEGDEALLHVTGVSRFAEIIA